MRYILDIQPGEADQEDFIDEGRCVTEQRLAFLAKQAKRLCAFLIWNLRLENLAYNCDYLTDDCATRVRDALYSVLGGVLEPVFAAIRAPMTRQQIDPMMGAQPGLMLGMDLGLGPCADRPLSEWQESFLPMALERKLRRARITTGMAMSNPWL